MIIRDYYFGAWLVNVHGYQFIINDGKVIIEIDKHTLTLLKKEYIATTKPLFDRVKYFIKSTNSERENANTKEG